MKKRFLTRAFVNSTMMFVLSYLVIHLNNQLLTIFIAKDFDIQTMWYFSHIEMYPDMMSAEVSQDIRIAITMAVPSASLLLALAGQFAYLSSTMKHASLSYFLLWWISHGYNQFFGMFGLAPFLGNYQQYVTGVLSLSLPVKIVLATASLFILYKIGENMGKATLAKTGEYAINTSKNRLEYLTVSLLLPWITGSLLIFAFSGGKSIEFGYSFLTLAAVILSAFLTGRKPLEKEIEKQYFNNNISIIALIITIASSLGYYLLTLGGVGI